MSWARFTVFEKYAGVTKNCSKKLINSLPWEIFLQFENIFTGKIISVLSNEKKINAVKDVRVGIPASPIFFSGLLFTTA